MLNSDPQPLTEPEIQALLGPSSGIALGALIVAALASLIVTLIWLAFYFLVFLPRTTP
jgi:hypothetical protein